MPQIANIKSLRWRLLSWKLQFIVITFSTFSPYRHKSFGYYSPSHCYHKISFLILTGKLFINQKIDTKLGIIKIKNLQLYLN